MSLADGRLLQFACGLFDSFRDFSWLTRNRVTFYSGVLFTAYLVAAICQLATAHHL